MQSSFGLRGISLKAGMDRRRLQSLALTGMVSTCASLIFLGCSPQTSSNGLSRSSGSGDRQVVSVGGRSSDSGAVSGGGSETVAESITSITLQVSFVSATKFNQHVSSAISAVNFDLKDGNDDSILIGSFDDLEVDSTSGDLIVTWSGDITGAPANLQFQLDTRTDSPADVTLNRVSLSYVRGGEKTDCTPVISLSAQAIGGDLYGTLAFCSE